MQASALRFVMNAIVRLAFIRIARQYKISRNNSPNRYDDLQLNEA
jgi:hypothetical protein